MVGITQWILFNGYYSMNNLGADVVAPSRQLILASLVTVRLATTGSVELTRLNWLVGTGSLELTRLEPAFRNWIVCTGLLDQFSLLAHFPSHSLSVLIKPLEITPKASHSKKEVHLFGDDLCKKHLEFQTGLCTLKHQAASNCRTAPPADRAAGRLVYIQFSVHSVITVDCCSMLENFLPNPSLLLIWIFVKSVQNETC